MKQKLKEKKFFSQKLQKKKKKFQKYINFNIFNNKLYLLIYILYFIMK